MKIDRLLFLLIAFATNPSHAQDMSYGKFIEGVYSGNVSLAAKKLNIPIKEAELQASRMIVSPELSVSYDNNSDWDIQMGQSVSMELSKPLEPGKRHARIALAQKSLDASNAAFQDYLRNLRADATINFIDALYARDMAAVGLHAYENMRELYLSDSIRYVKGDISELDVIQTRLEERCAYQEYNSRMTDYKNSLVVLDQLCGNSGKPTSSVSGVLCAPDSEFNLDNLIAVAVENREDVIAALKDAGVAEEELNLIRKERRPSLSVTLGASYNTKVRNEIAPAPQYVGYSAGISVPIPFANINKAEITSGRLRIKQAQTNTMAVRSDVKSEIIRAFNKFESARLKVKDYDMYLIENAHQILEGKIYAYNRGETSLLDVLNAQSTHNSVLENYTMCLYECMAAWIELERSSGIWDISM